MFVLPCILNLYLGMGTDLSKFDKQVIRRLKDEITILKKQDKFNKYCINHLKAEIRLLRDNITKSGVAYKECLYKHKAINEKSNMKLENGTHMTHNGDEIKYVGENMPVFGTQLKMETLVINFKIISNINHIFISSFYSIIGNDNQQNALEGEDSLRNWSPRNIISRTNWLYRVYALCNHDIREMNLLWEISSLFLE